MLLEEFLKPMGIGQVEAARRLGISLNRLNEIVLGKRGITADTALRLGRLLKTSPQFWMRLQADWDLQEAIQRARRKASWCSKLNGERHSCTPQILRPDVWAVSGRKILGVWPAILMNGSLEYQVSGFGQPNSGWDRLRWVDAVPELAEPVPTHAGAESRRGQGHRIGWASTTDPSGWMEYLRSTALNVSPRVGHLHVHVDDLLWLWADASDINMIDLAGMPPGRHKILIELVNANHEIFPDSPRQ
jgi:antitoxin HigA-1